MEEIRKNDIKTNPQKHFMKAICKLLYVAGLGDCWYEENTLYPFFKNYYPIFAFFSHFYYVTVLAGEILALVRDDLTVEERSDAQQFVIGHPTVYLKFVILIIQRHKIKEFFKKIFEDTRNYYTNVEIERAAIRRAKWYCSLLAITMTLTLSTATVNGLVQHYRTGITMRTLVTYWPTSRDSGWIVEVARIFIQLYWWYLVTTMVIIDSTCLCSLLFLAFRFKAICQYFKELGDKFVDERETIKSDDEIQKEFTEGFVNGIRFHEQTLQCARSLQGALGNIYSVQVVQSIGLLAICLVKFVRIELGVTFLVANLAFIQCMVMLTATYMTAAGDITNEAELIPTAIFHCGWERCSNTRIRTLVTIAVQCSQRMIVMTSFGIFNLSYSTLITIARASYSFFAVMY